MMSRGTRASVGSTFAAFANFPTTSTCVSGLGSPMLNASPTARGSSIDASHGLHQIVNVHELHQAVAVAGDDDGAAGAQPVPEKLLAVERIPRPVDERRPERHQRQSALRLHAEQQPLGRGLVADVGIGRDNRAPADRSPCDSARRRKPPRWTGKYSGSGGRRRRRTVASTCSAVVPRSQS